MAFVEWLRVRACLKWTLIVLGIFFLIVVAVRVAIIGKHDYIGWVAGLKSEPGSKVTETTLPDGTHRVTVVDPKGVRVTLDEHGTAKHIEIYDPSGETSRELEHNTVSMGSVSEHELPNHQGTVTVVDTDGSTDFLAYIVCGVIVAMIVATILGAPFGREGEHLEIAFTKPVSRDVLGVATIATDMAGILAAFAAGVAFALLVHLLFEIPSITFSARDAVALGCGILAPLSWYAMLAAATASLKRGWGAVVGFAWPVALVVLGLSLIQPEGNAVLTLVRDVAAGLSFIDPLRYMHFGSQSTGMVGGSIAESDGFKIGMLGLLAVVYSALALVQWRRIQA